MSVTVDNAEYAALRDRGLRLDLTRGKPSPQQLDLLAFARDDDYQTADGTDSRNYGGLSGLLELREIFSGLLQVPAGQLLALGNSSLTLMHDIVAHALLFPLPGSAGGWLGGSAFLCPVPGYDRHFAICEKFGIEMIQVPMLSDGPDMDVVEELAAGDPRIKGMWCVPKYSNPTGACYSSATIERLARMRTAAADFRLFWDNAYAVHFLTADGPAHIAPVLDACVLRDGLTGIGSWTRPEGGYFMTLDAPDGCAAAVVRLAADAGIALTPAGATHPYGRDPRDRTIRLAPTFPSLTELEQAMRGLVTCVRFAAGGGRP